MKPKRFFLVMLFPLLAFSVYESLIPDIPGHFPKPVYNFNKEPLSYSKIELGRMLFYDPILSKDGKISCSSCHSSFNAFSHTDHALSHGIHDSIGKRNAPALFNIAWQRNFMWDGAINHIEVQALAPISNEKEMGENIENIRRKLQQDIKYPGLFYEAFGDSVITGQHILKALAQFELTLISSYSKYDSVKNGDATFSEQEKKGYKLFLKNCNSCHQEPLFSSYQFANNGLPVDLNLNDYGRWHITKNTRDSLLFKIPSLRNLSYTYPYMHDGRFRKLYQVLNHYTSGIKPSHTLSPQLRNGIRLTPDEKVDLIAFLLTLNDKEFIFDKKYQFPKEALLNSKTK